MYGQTIDSNHYATSFYHEQETAYPGYYSVVLTNGVKAEMTTTTRCGYSIFTYPIGVRPQIQLDLGWSINWDRTVACYIKKISDYEWVGYRFSSGWDKNEKVYFDMVFNEPVQSVDSIRYLSGKGLNVFFNFAVTNHPIQVKTGISFHSIEGATKNLQTELINNPLLIC